MMAVLRFVRLGTGTTGAGRRIHESIEHGALGSVMSLNGTYPCILELSGSSELGHTIGTAFHTHANGPFSQSTLSPSSLARYPCLPSFGSETPSARPVRPEQDGKIRDSLIAAHQYRGTGIRRTQGPPTNPTPGPSTYLPRQQAFRQGAMLTIGDSSVSRSESFQPNKPKPLFAAGDTVTPALLDLHRRSYAPRCGRGTGSRELESTAASLVRRFSAPLLLQIRGRRSNLVHAGMPGKLSKMACS